MSMFCRNCVLGLDVSGVHVVWVKVLRLDPATCYMLFLLRHIPSLSLRQYYNKNSTDIVLLKHTITRYLTNTYTHTSRDINGEAGPPTWCVACFDPWPFSTPTNSLLHMARYKSNLIDWLIDWPCFDFRPWPRVMVCGGSVFWHLTLFWSMTLVMCSGVETIANFNHRPLYRAHGAVVLACFDLWPWPCVLVWKQ